MGKPRYEIREICGDWALDIPPYGPKDTDKTLFFNSRSNADLVKAILEWEDAHPNKAVPYPPTLTPQDEWVSVKDRLPYAEYGESNSVLCVTKIGTQIVLYFDGGCWCYPTGETFCHGVTHWMPLPEPPEEG